MSDSDTGRVPPGAALDLDKAFVELFGEVETLRAAIRAHRDAPKREAPGAALDLVGKVRLIVARFRALGGVPELCDLTWKLCNENEALRAALDARPPQAPQEWHPIETAPKDGTMILLYPSRLWADDCDRGEAGYWDADQGVWGGAGSPADDYAGPTHWQPLPHPPAADARRPGQE